MVFIVLLLFTCVFVLLLFSSGRDGGGIGLFFFEVFFFCFILIDIIFRERRGLGCSKACALDVTFFFFRNVSYSRVTLK